MRLRLQELFIICVLGGAAIPISASACLVISAVNEGLSRPSEFIILEVDASGKLR